MEEKEFISKMDNLKKPDFSSSEPGKNLKLAIVNSKKSAAMGVWFLLVPCYFLFAVIMKYYFNINLHIIDIFEEFIASLDKSPVTKFITPLFFVVLPIAGIVINLLSIMFFEYNKEQKQINISIKLKALNILLAIISLAVVSIFMLYLITENLHHINN
jgi:lantibiotic transport system permease protein